MPKIDLLNVQPSALFEKTSPCTISFLGCTFSKSILKKRGRKNSEPYFLGVEIYLKKGGAVQIANLFFPGSALFEKTGSREFSLLRENAKRTI